MVNALLLALASAAVVLGDETSYKVNAGCTNDQLVRWHDADRGLWLGNTGTQYWWQSANMLTAFNDFARLDPSVKDHYSSIWDTTFQNAPLHNPDARAVRGADGRMHKAYTLHAKPRRQVRRQESGGFINHFYDDEAWWALAWIGALDNTGRKEYLDEAIAIWYDMTEAWGRPTCGGIPWNKDEDAPALAIQNELYIHLSAILANRVGSDQKDTYLNAAKKGWAWFQEVELINSDNLINDGVDRTTCKNSGAPIYTYNQGVILGGLVELYHATGDASYLDRASDIANAVTRPGSRMLSDEGILVDGCDRNQDCSGDGVTFKGVFARELKKLQALRPSEQWKGFLETNARSIWKNDLAIENGACKVGVYWGGPYTEAEASSQASGLDCLNAAIAVTS